MSGADVLMRQMALSQRNEHPERASFPIPALDGDRTAMKPCQFLNEGKPNARAFIRTTLRPGDAMEPLKNLSELVLQNACPCITNDQNDVTRTFRSR